MSNKNDQKILDLQKKVDEKKAALAKTQRFSPVTNCTLAFEGERFNLNTLDVDGCTLLLVRMNTYLMSAKDLGIETPVVISGYSLENWVKDLKAKLAYLQREAEKRKLQQTEKKLEALLSTEVKTELAIDEIANSLV